LVVTAWSVSTVLKSPADAGLALASGVSAFLAACRDW